MPLGIPGNYWTEPSQAIGLVDQPQFPASGSPFVPPIVIGPPGHCEFILQSYCPGSVFNNQSFGPSIVTNQTTVVTNSYYQTPYLYIATTSGLFIWDYSTDTLVGYVTGVRDQVNSVVISADGSTIIAWAQNDPDSPATGQVVSTSTNAITGINVPFNKGSAINLNGSVSYSNLDISSKANVFSYSTQTGEFIASGAAGTANYVDNIIVSPDGSKVFSSPSTAYSTSSLAPLYTLSTVNENGIVIGGFTPDGETGYYLGNEYNYLCSFPISSGISTITSYNNPTTSLIDFVVSNDGTMIYVVYEGKGANYIDAINTSTWTVVSTLFADDSVQYSGSIAITPDSKYVYMGVTLGMYKYNTQNQEVTLVYSHTTYDAFVYGMVSRPRQPYSTSVTTGNSFETNQPCDFVQQPYCPSSTFKRI